VVPHLIRWLSEHSTGGYVLIRRGGGEWRVSVRAHGRDWINASKELGGALDRSAQRLTAYAARERDGEP